MIAEHSSFMQPHELHYLFPPLCADIPAPSPSSSPSPPPLSGHDSDSSCSDPTLSPLSTAPSSPSIKSHSRQTLFRLLPKSLIPSTIQLGAWTSISLEVVDEFGGFRSGADSTDSFKLQDGKALVPLECYLLFECDGQISRQSSPNHSLLLETRALESTNWLGLESLASAGIGPSRTGGLEVRVMAKEEKVPSKFWIGIGSEHDQMIVPLVIGPLTPSANPCRSYDAHHVLRPISILRRNGLSLRIMLLQETWNNVPQGRVWDSAFVLMDFFSKQVTEGLLQTRPAVFAGKRILDLSAGTGLLGIFLAGMAQVELDSSSPIVPLKSSSSQCRSLPRSTGSFHSTPSTTVILTDLREAMGLINHNISSNRARVAPSVDLVAKELVWGIAPLARLNSGELDIVIASDVVYEADSFKVLLQTLYGLCTPRRTTVYLAYKQRGLHPDKEREFFRQVEAKFIVEKTLHSLDVQLWRLKR